MGKVAKEVVLPTRPSLVSVRDNAVLVFANYFQLITDGPVEVLSYTFQILGGKKQEDDIKGASARQIFKTALENLRIPAHEYATDYKQQIVTLRPLNEKQLTVDGCIVKFFDPVPVCLDISVSDTPSQNVIDCLNLIIGQRRREQTEEMAAIGRHRFFPSSTANFTGENDRGDVFETPIPEMLSVSRGFFLGVRPGVEYLLLNVNATFGVFRPHGEIRELYDRLRTRHQLDNVTPGKKFELLSRLHQAISRARVYYQPPWIVKAQQAARTTPKTVPIAGFARKTDSSPDKDHPLQIDSDFPGPDQVTFWVKEGEKYVPRTVKAHFQKSEFNRLRL